MSERGYSIVINYGPYRFEATELLEETLHAFNSRRLELVKTSKSDLIKWVINRGGKARLYVAPEIPWYKRPLLRLICYLYNSAAKSFEEKKVANSGYYCR